MIENWAKKCINDQKRGYRNDMPIVELVAPKMTPFHKEFYRSFYDELRAALSAVPPAEPKQPHVDALFVKFAENVLAEPTSSVMIHPSSAAMPSTPSSTAPTPAPTAQLTSPSTTTTATASTTPFATERSLLLRGASILASPAATRVAQQVIITPLRCVTDYLLLC
jgi:hypothetical protein